MLASILLVGCGPTKSNHRTIHTPYPVAVEAPNGTLVLHVNGVLFTGSRNELLALFHTFPVKLKQPPDSSFMHLAQYTLKRVNDLEFHKKECVAIWKKVDYEGVTKGGWMLTGVFQETISKQIEGVAIQN